MTDVLLVRAAGGDDQDAQALRARGLTVVEDPYLVVASSADAGAEARARSVLAAISDDADWLIVTSSAAIRALEALAGADAVVSAVEAGHARGIRFAAVGPTTAEALMRRRVVDIRLPIGGTAASLADELAAEPVARAVFPRGSQAMKGLPARLRASGWTVDDVVVYETMTVANRPRTADRVAAGEFDAIVVRSPTALRALAAYEVTVPSRTALVCGGPTTAAEARRLGHSTIVVSPGPTAQAVAETVLRATDPADTSRRSQND